ncbi:hypothetical protein [Stenotrophomonas cyclobalanopsidis]|uniref:hypothetical protein n=1 Tax=Stenotrophomonas cyclobalanopsidis TaxID=2771362 RepID=UPI0034605401
MSSESIENSLGHLAEHRLDFLTKALERSIHATISGGLSGIVLEETTTGALLGSISSNIRSQMQNSPDLADMCHWTQYRKGGNDFSSETWTGIDISIILRLGKEKFRMASFQAKRSANLKSGFEAIQISPGKGDYPPEPQLIRMLRYGIKYEPSTPIATSVSGADWIHFLIYSQDKMCHEPLSSMNDYCQRVISFDARVKKLHLERNASEKAEKILKRISEDWKLFDEKTHTPKEENSLFELFSAGTTLPPDAPAAGWKNISGIQAAREAIEAMAPDSLIMEAAMCKDYKPIISHSDSIKVLHIHGASQKAPQNEPMNEANAAALEVLKVDLTKRTEIYRKGKKGANSPSDLSNKNVPGEDLKP